MLVHRQRGTVLYFHQATSEKKIIAIPGIHFFDAHRLDAATTPPGLATSQNRKEQVMPWMILPLTKNFPRLMEATRLEALR